VIVKEFRTRFNAIITNGQGSMKGQISGWRISVISISTIYSPWLRSWKSSWPRMAAPYGSRGVAARRLSTPKVALPKPELALSN